MAEINVQSLKDRITSGARQTAQGPRTAMVKFSVIGLVHTLFSKEEEREQLEALRAKLEEVNDALDSCEENERLELTIKLYQLWVGGEVEEVREVLGDCVDLRSLGRRAMLTLSGNGRQLRIWYSFPGNTRSGMEHVDSCGISLLFGVYGHSAVVQKYTSALAGGLRELVGEHNVRFYI